MTTRVRGFLVVLDADYREDDIEDLRKAVGAFRGVVKVENIPTHPSETAIAIRERHHLRERLFKALEDPE